MESIKRNPVLWTIWTIKNYLKSKKEGLVSLTGKKLTDCIYDFAFYTNGIAILGKDGKDGLYLPGMTCSSPVNMTPSNTCRKTAPTSCGAEGDTSRKVTITYVFYIPTLMAEWQTICLQISGF